MLTEQDHKMAEIRNTIEANVKVGTPYDILAVAHSSGFGGIEYAYILQMHEIAVLLKAVRRIDNMPAAFDPETGDMSDEDCAEYLSEAQSLARDALRDRTPHMQPRHTPETALLAGMDMIMGVGHA
jgi:hypothetical protein